MAELLESNNETWRQRCSGPYFVLYGDEWIIGQWQYGTGPNGWVSVLGWTDQPGVADDAFDDVDEDMILRQ